MYLELAVQKYGSRTRKKSKLDLGESVPSQFKRLNIYYFNNVSNDNVLHKPHQNVSLSKVSHSLGQI